MSDSDEQICPLCCEELDVADQNFLPCKCGYQVCMWCWHHIKENLNNLCPACRGIYSDNPHAFSAVEKEEIMQNKLEMKVREKEKKERNKEKREEVIVRTGIERIPLPSEHPITLRRGRAGSDVDSAPNRQQRRAEAKRNQDLLEEQQRQQALQNSMREQQAPAGRPPRPAYGYGASTDNLTSLGGEYGFGRGGSTGLDSLLGGVRAAPPPPQPPLDVAGLWNTPAPAPPPRENAFRLDASPVASSGFFDSGSIWSTNAAPAGDGWGAPAPAAQQGFGGQGFGGYGGEAASSDAYAADSLAADTAALNLLSVGYGEDRRRYAPQQGGYGAARY